MFSVALKLGGPRRLSHYRPLPITPGLRGFAEEQSQLRAGEAKTKASVTGLAARFCPTGRDLYLEKRLKVDTGPSWERHVLGRVVDKALLKFHHDGMELMEDAFERSVSTDLPVDIDELEGAIKQRGIEIMRAQLLEEWKYEGSDKTTYGSMTLEEFADAASGGKGELLVDKTLEALSDLVNKETDDLGRYLRKRRLLQPFLSLIGVDWMAEARATMSRLEGERPLDNEDSAAFFGVSKGVVPDILYAVTLIGDVKTGTYHDFYESVAVSYVLVAEWLLKRRINTAAIFSIDFDLESGKVRSKDVYIVSPDDEKRRVWVAQRDFALKVLNADDAPRHPDDLEPCKKCPYVRSCWVDAKIGGTATTPPPPPKKDPKKDPKKGKTNA